MCGSAPRHYCFSSETMEGLGARGGADYSLMPFTLEYAQEGGPGTVPCRKSWRIHKQSAGITTSQDGLKTEEGKKNVVSGYCGFIRSASRPESSQTTVCATCIHKVPLLGSFLVFFVLSGGVFCGCLPVIDVRSYCSPLNYCSPIAYCSPILVGFLAWSAMIFFFLGMFTSDRRQKLL